MSGAQPARCVVVGYDGTERGVEMVNEALSRRSQAPARLADKDCGELPIGFAVRCGRRPGARGR
jgi:hypothetical protein